MGISAAQKSKFWVEQAIKFIIYKIQGLPFYRAVVRSFRIDIEIEEDQAAGQKGTTSFVAKSGSRIAGSVQLAIKEIDNQPMQYWLFGLMVNIFYRRLGIGRRLTEIVINKAKEEGAKAVHLFVYTYNHRAIDFYRRLGFRQVVMPLIEAELEGERQLSGFKRITMIKDLK